MFKHCYISEAQKYPHKMNSDEERLYDPSEVGIIDATEPSTAEITSDSNQSTSSPSPIPTAAPAKFHRWFILEPAVFLVFLAMYLSGEFFFKQIKSRSLF